MELLARDSLTKMGTDKFPKLSAKAQKFEILMKKGLNWASVVRDNNAADDMMEPNIFDYYLFQLQKFYPEQKIIL